MTPLAFALPFLLSTAPVAGYSSCAVSRQLLPTAVSPSFAVLRATPDSLSDGTYFAVATRDAYARQADATRAPGTVVYGQVFELLRSEGRHAVAAARSTRAVVVWWGSDTMCRRSPSGRAALVPKGELFIMAAPRDPSEWVSGLPTYDVLRNVFIYSPDLPVPGTATRTLNPMKMEEFVAMFRLLPDSAVFARDPVAAVSRLLAWDAADTTRRSLWPAIVALCPAHGLQQTGRMAC